MIEITLKEAINQVKELFDVVPFKEREEAKSFFNEDKETGAVTFLFDKRQYTRNEVIDKLVNHFSDKYIVDGQCRIDSITLLWTFVYLEPANNSIEG